MTMFKKAYDKSFSKFVDAVVPKEIEKTGGLLSMSTAQIPGKSNWTVNIPVMLGTYAVYRIIQKLHADTVRKALIQDLMDNDPVIKGADRDQIMEWYATIYNVAPDLSKEKSLVRELLRNFITFGKIDLQTIKTLAGTEKDMAKNSPLALASKFL